MVAVRLPLTAALPVRTSIKSRDLPRRKSRGKKRCAHATMSLLPTTAAQPAQDSEVRK